MDGLEPSLAFWATALLGPPVVFCACALAAHFLLGRPRGPRRRLGGGRR